MNGFAPLLEGFLAFALTMLALTTGVSAIVGAVHRLRRRHARGLRDMVRLLYLRELVPLLDRAESRARNGDMARSGVTMSSEADVEPAGTTANGMEIARRGELTYELTMTPVPHVAERPASEEDPKRKAAGLQAGSKKAAVTESARRAEFIYDMTFMPLHVVIEKLETMGEGYWRTKLESAERLVGRPWYSTPLHLKRVVRHWRTLRYSLEALKDDEFRDRLASSDVGLQLKEQKAWEKCGLASWDDLVAYLLKRFQTIGGASSETFARHSRGWSMAVGFTLAVALNVDSIDLLNSYLTDPALRQQVIVRADAIRGQQVPAPAEGQTTTLAPARRQLATASTQLADAAQGLTGTVDALTSKLGADEGQRLAAAVQSELQGVLEQVKGLQTGFGELDQDLTEAEQRIRGVTRSLTTSFPIGWKRFPNCGATDSRDLRCEGTTFAPDPSGSGLWGQWSATLSAARTADPVAFHQWLLGVLLTGLLLGLGTPFWVQAVSAAFSLRRWREEKDETRDAEESSRSTGKAQRPTQSIGPAAGGIASTPLGS